MRGRKMTQDEFIERAKAIHGDTFDYSKVEFVSMNDRVCIKCLKHNVEFMQFPINHLRGCGCPKCKGEKISKIKSSNAEDFISKSTQTHNNKYDYSKVNYKDYQSKVCIICPEHGEFWQKPAIHLRGCGCPRCKYELNAAKCTLTTKQFIERAEKVHGKEMFDYSEVQYINTHVPITIKCRYGHRFEIKPCDHLHRESSGGCPICNHSKGEYAIMQYLETHNIEYIQEYKIIPKQTLFGRKYFRVDFYLPQHNIFIEFHGEQHYRPVGIWDNSLELFHIQQDRDKRLREYCKDNSIKLIEIPYNKIKSINRILGQMIK